MTSPKAHQEAFQSILKELHEVSARLHAISEEVCLQKNIIETIVLGLSNVRMDKVHIPTAASTSVAHDILNAEERRDNATGNTDREDQLNHDTNIWSDDRGKIL